MHIMVDIETLSPESTGRILQVSAIAFELNGKVQDPHELLQYEDRWFDAVIRPYPTGHEDARTMQWWASDEPAAAKKLLDARPQEALTSALMRFSAFARHWLGKRGGVWAKPPQFDLRILRATYEAFGYPAPWHYRQEHDLRTLVWVARKVPQVYFQVPSTAGAGLVPHYGLHDAVEQAVLAQAAHRALTLTAAARSRERRATLALSKREKTHESQEARGEGSGDEGSGDGAES